MRLDRLVAGAARGVDRFFAEAVLVRGRRPAYDVDERIAALKELVATSESAARTLGDAFFPEPEGVVVRKRPVRRIPRGRVVDLAWTSMPPLAFPEVASLVRGLDRNATGRARLFQHDVAGRPAVILVHGYLGGAFPAEEWVWPVRSFYRAGLDVALVVLPGHGARKDGPRVGPPTWPGADPLASMEGYRQAIFDLRVLLDAMVARGATAVGALGMSLGGYTSALLATVEPRLAFVAPFITLASVPDFMRDNGQIRGTPLEVFEQHALLERMYAPTSPLARVVRVPSEGRMVLALADDVVTPISHARRIARHFGVPVQWFPGGHILQLGRGQAFQAVVAELARRGMLPGRG